MAIPLITNQRMAPECFPIGEGKRKIVVNALAYKKNSSGIGVMLRELCRAYSRAAKRPCRVVMPQDSPDFPVGENTELLRVPWNYSQSLRRVLFQTFIMGRRYCRNAVLLTSDSKCPFFLPKDCTLLPLITDLAVYRMPEVYRRSRVFLWRLQYRYVRHRADLFLAISEFTKKEMVELWHIPPEKVHIVPCACTDTLGREKDPRRLRALKEKYHLPEHFVLFVGNSNPRKNLTRLLRAFDDLKERNDIPHQLVIAGEQGWKFDKDNVLSNLKHREAVRFIGFVSDEDMAALYSAASLFVFPTLYEGFGIPVLEAQSCGVPVLASNCASLPEVGGDGAYYVDPYNEKEIAEGIGKLLTRPELAEKLARLGNENVKRFSWEKSAGRLEEIIEKGVGA